MSGSPSQPRGELELIRRLRRQLEPEARAPGGVSFGDDMARLAPSAGDWLWTVDMLQDGVDFDSGAHDWELIGRKAMAVNLSDCAAMGVRPAAALAAIALNEALSLDDATALIHGMQRLGSEHGCLIVGGDTNSWAAPTVVSVTVAGRPEPEAEPVCRSGAQPGDTIWLSGPVGGSILGRHLSFEPRVALGCRVARELRPHAMIDISDGLALDLWRIAEASGCQAVIETERLEALIHPDAVKLAARDRRPAREHALHDGEDFELIIVTGEDTPVDQCAACGLRRLGAMHAGAGIALFDGCRTTPLEPQGWEHFK